MGKVHVEREPIREKINLLFEVFVKPDGKPYTNVEVAQQVGISDRLIAGLRTKDYRNPTLGTLEALCNFFDIPLDYFTCETDKDARLYLARVKSGLPAYDPEQYKSDELVGEIMAKAMSMSVDARRDILKVMEWVEYGDKARPRIETLSASTG